MKTRQLLAAVAVFPVGWFFFVPAVVPADERVEAGGRSHTANPAPAHCAGSYCSDGD
jgi:hypothetical protein